MMKYTMKKYLFFALLLVHKVQASHEISPPSFAHQQYEQAQLSSSFKGKFCFGCYSDNAVQVGPQEIVSAEQNNLVQQKTLPKNKTATTSVQIVPHDLELTETSTVVSDSTTAHSLLDVRKKPTEKKSFLQSVTQYFKTATIENVNAQNNKGFTQLHTAVLQGDVTEIMRLLDAGADVNIINHEGDSPLLIAVRNSGKDRYGYEYAYITQCLLERGAMCNQQDRLGLTPLHWAVENLSTDIVDVLLAYKVNVNIQNDRGYTPLMLIVRKNMPVIDLKPKALHNEQAYIVKSLVQAGADPRILCFDDKQSAYGYASYQIAFKKNMLPVIGDDIHKALMKFQQAAVTISIH